MAVGLTVPSLLKLAKVSRLMYQRLTAHSSFCSRSNAPTKRMIAASLGKICTTLVQPLERVRRVDLRPVTLRERHVGEHVVLGLVHRGCYTWEAFAQTVGDGAILCTRLFLR